MNMSKPYSSMTWYIRADGNGTIGTGHLMRCLSIADAFLELGGSSVFLTAEEECADLIQDRGYEYLCLNSSWEHLEEELPKLSKIIKEQEVSTLLVDSCYVTDKYLQELCGKVYVAYLDDLNLFHYPCQSIINYSVYYQKFNYNARYPDVRLLLGTGYVPLQKPYSEIGKKQIKEQAEQILILTGGTDEYSFALSMAEYAVESAEREKRTYIFICGKYNKDLKQLQKVQDKSKNIICIPGTDKMWDYMKEADLAVSAGGTTLYELCASGTPTVCYTLADNQLENVKAFAERELMLDAGDIRLNKMQVIRRTMDMIAELSSSQAQRQIISENMQYLVDGKGAQRIVQEILGAR